MAKTIVEFNCYMCSHYVYAKMNVEINGNYIVHCPNCGHKHYRKIEKGKITDRRFDENCVSYHELIIPKSAAVPYAQRREKGLTVTARELSATK